MLLKWVICEVSDPERFAAGQSGWSALRDCPGFLGQAGGWSTRHPGRAHLFGLWNGWSAYRSFMSTVHDDLAAAQHGSYHSTEIHLFDEVRRTGRPFTAERLRLAHQTSHPTSVRTEHLSPAPAFAAAAAVLSGATASILAGARAAPGPTAVLALAALPPLAARPRRAGSDSAVAGLTEDVIALVTEWTVGCGASIPSGE